ncbi:unnamed protein product [Closterium sp. NIES-65]|nr:unnamed protein product [Closterium sp. NIES-65]
MARSVLSVGLVLFLAVVLTLSCVSLVFKRKVEDCYSLSLVRTQKSMDKCKEDLLAQIAQCGGKPVRTEYPLAGGASKPSKSQSLPANPSPYNAMARAILSVALAIFLAAILALSFAQATSAEAAGVVTAENAASTALLNEVPREVQRHRKLIPSFADGTMKGASLLARTNQT